MKNKKLSLGFASAFVAILSLTACSGVSANDKAIVTYKDSAGNETTILTDSIYDKYRTTSDGISKFYTAILETVIRHEFDTKGSDEAVYKKTNKQINDEAKNNVESSKQEAEDNAKTNSTSYSEEWDKILEANGCEDEAELLQNYIYKIEKTEIEDKYFNENKDRKSTTAAESVTLTEEYIGVSDTGTAVATHGNVNSAYPYHIRHVLISISDGKTAYANDKITKDEAKNLGTVIDYLTDVKYTFAQTATKLSGDSSSAEKGGDVGIMTTTTSFVNEFKLGIYAYDAVFNTAHAAGNAAIENGLGISSNINLIDTDTVSPTTKTVKEALNGKFDKVPYDALNWIGDEYDTEKVNGVKVNDGNEDYFPRNIVWNNYLNKHNPFLITNQRFVKDGNGERTTTIEIDSSKTNAKWTEPDSEGIRYLTDGEGHIIIGVRSEHGLHFMICQKSIYDFCEKADNKVTLEEYYTNLVPGDEDFPHYTDASGNRIEKNTYVNYISSEDKSEYNTRATEVKDAIKSFDSTYSYRIYENLVASKKITFNGTDGRNLGTQINKYIEASRIDNKNTADKTLNDSWKSYIELLNVQDQERNYVTGTTTVGGENIKRVVNIRCAVGFKSHSGTDWLEGGMCYYEA